MVLTNLFDFYKHLKEEFKSLKNPFFIEKLIFYNKMKNKEPNE